MSELSYERRSTVEISADIAPWAAMKTATQTLGVIAGKGEDRRLELVATVDRRPREFIRKGQPLFDHWQQKLGDYRALLFRTLWGSSKPLTRLEIAERSQRSPKSSAFNESVAWLIKKGFFETVDKRLEIPEFFREVMS